jgi:O-acetylserine/cysteine efflux transporter
MDQKLTKVPLRDTVFLFAIAIIWGVNAILTKLALNELPPLFLGVCRLGLTLVLLIAFIKPVGLGWRPLLIVCLLTGPFHYGVQFIGLQMAQDLSPMIIAMQFWIPASVILAAVFLNEKVTLVRGLGIAVAFAGVAIVVFEPSVFTQLTAFGLVVMASVAYGSASVIMRKYGGLDPIQAQAWVAIATVPTLGLASLANEIGQVAALLNASPIVWFSIAFAAIFAGIIGNGGMWMLVQKHGVSLTTPISMLTPIVAIGLGIWILGDPMSLQFCIGALLALAGVGVVAMSKA